MSPPQKVKIRDVAPRDGFQSWPEFIPTDQKLEIIRSIADTGVSEIETTSFVNPKVIPQMRDAADVITPYKSYIIENKSEKSRGLQWNVF